LTLPNAVVKNAEEGGSIGGSISKSFSFGDFGLTMPAFSVETVPL